MSHKLFFLKRWKQKLLKRFLAPYRRSRHHASLLWNLRPTNRRGAVFTPHTSPYHLAVVSAPGRFGTSARAPTAAATRAPCPHDPPHRPSALGGERAETDPYLNFSPAGTASLFSLSMLRTAPSGHWPRSSRCPAINTARTSLPAEPTQGRTAAAFGYWSLSLPQPQAHAEDGPGAGATGPAPPGPPPPGLRRAQVGIPPEMGQPARGLGLRGPGFPLLLTALPSGDAPCLLLWRLVPSVRCCNETRDHCVAPILLDIAGRKIEIFLLSHSKLKPDPSSSTEWSHSHPKCKQVICG